MENLILDPVLSPKYQHPELDSPLRKLNSFPSTADWRTWFEFQMIDAVMSSLGVPWIAGEAKNKRHQTARRARHTITRNYSRSFHSTPWHEHMTAELVIELLKLTNFFSILFFVVFGSCWWSWIAFARFVAADIPFLWSHSKPVLEFWAMSFMRHLIPPN